MAVDLSVSDTDDSEIQQLEYGKKSLEAAKREAEQKLRTINEAHKVLERDNLRLHAQLFGMTKQEQSRSPSGGPSGPGRTKPRSGSRSGSVPRAAARSVGGHKASREPSAEVEDEAIAPPIPHSSQFEADELATLEAENAQMQNQLERMRLQISDTRRQHENETQKAIQRIEREYTDRLAEKEQELAELKQELQQKNVQYTQSIRRRQGIPVTADDTDSEAQVTSSSMHQSYQSFHQAVEHQWQQLHEQWPANMESPSVQGKEDVAEGTGVMRVPGRPGTWHQSASPSPLRTSSGRSRTPGSPIRTSSPSRNLSASHTPQLNSESRGSPSPLRGQRVIAEAKRRASPLRGQQVHGEPKRSPSPVSGRRSPSPLRTAQSTRKEEGRVSPGKRMGNPSPRMGNPSPRNPTPRTRAGLGRSPSPKSRMQSEKYIGPPAKQSTKGPASVHERGKPAATAHAQNLLEERGLNRSASATKVGPGIQAPVATLKVEPDSVPLAPREYTPQLARAAPAGPTGQNTLGLPTGSAGVPTPAGARPPPQASSRSWVYGAQPGARLEHQSPSPVRNNFQNERPGGSIFGQHSAVSTAAPHAPRILNAPTAVPQPQTIQPSRSMPSLHNGPGSLRR